MKQAVPLTGRGDHRTRLQDADSLLAVLAFSLAGLLGCLVSLAPLDGPTFTVVRSLMIMASAFSTALTGFGFGGGE